MTTAQPASADVRLLPINWPVTQTMLRVKPDGVAGPLTYAALFAKAAERPADATILAIGKAAAERFPAYGMTTRNRVAEFIAQCCNETGGFTAFVENLNYSVTALISTFGRHRISVADANRLGRKPGARSLTAEQQAAIANILYGGQWGRTNLGNTQPGDGWRYRGRGALHVTGRANYRSAGQRLGLSLEQEPDLVVAPRVALLTALDFWKRAKVNDPCDRGDWREARRITNGGAIGLAHVAEIRNTLMGVIV
jgi:putative chitinase